MHAEAGELQDRVVNLLLAAAADLNEAVIAVRQRVRRVALDAQAGNSRWRGTR